MIMTGNRNLDCASALERHRPKSCCLGQKWIGDGARAPAKVAVGGAGHVAATVSPSSSPSRSQWMPLIAAAVKIETGMEGVPTLDSVDEADEQTARVPRPPPLTLDSC